MDLPAYWRTLYHMLPYSMKHGKHHLIFKRRRVLQKHAFAASPSEEFDAILAGCRTLCGRKGSGQTPFLKFHKVRDIYQSLCRLRCWLIASILSSST